jgi:hypothetical protein
MESGDITSSSDLGVFTRGPQGRENWAGYGCPGRGPPRTDSNDELNMTYRFYPDGMSKRERLDRSNEILFGENVSRKDGQSQPLIQLRELRGFVSGICAPIQWIC